MRSEDAARAVLLLILSVTFYLVYLIFRPFLGWISWSVVLVVTFEPVYARLVRLLRGREWTAAILLSTLLGAFIVVPAVLAILKVAQSLGDAYQWLQARSASGTSLLDQLRTYPWSRGPITWLERYVELDTIDLQGVLMSTLKTMGTSLASRTSAVLINGLELLMATAVVLITTAVLFREGPRVLDVVRRYLPLSARDKDEVLSQLRDATRAVFFGVLLTALVQAILGTIGFVIAGVPNAPLFGAAMFLAALLPAGPTVLWVPASIWLLATGHVAAGVFLFLWGLLLVSTVDNVVRPLFIKRGMQMPTILVFFGTLGGLFAFGLIGLFLGPLVITLFIFLLDVTRRNFFRDGDVSAAASAPTSAPLDSEGPRR